MSVVQSVDVTLEEALMRGPLRTANVQVSFETPDADWSAARTLPCVNLFLYGIEEDASRSQSGDLSVVDEEGTVVGYRRPPRYFRLTYLVSVWAQSVQDEHRMLGTLLGWCVQTEELSLRSPWRDAPARITLGLREAGDTTENVASRLWSSLGTAARPVLDLTVTVPLGKPTEQSGQAPVKGMGLRVREWEGVHDLGADARSGEEPDTSSGTQKPTEASPARPRRNVQEIA